MAATAFMNTLFLCSLTCHVCPPSVERTMRPEVPTANPGWSPTAAARLRLPRRGSSASACRTSWFEIGRWSRPPSGHLEVEMTSLTLMEALYFAGHPNVRIGVLEHSLNLLTQSRDPIGVLGKKESSLAHFS